MKRTARVSTRQAVTPSRPWTAQAVRPLTCVRIATDRARSAGRAMQPLPGRRGAQRVVDDPALAATPEPGHRRRPVGPGQSDADGHPQPGEVGQPEPHVQRQQHHRHPEQEEPVLEDVHQHALQAHPEPCGVADRPGQDVARLSRRLRAIGSLRVGEDARRGRR